MPDPEPPPGATALDRPRRIKLCGGLFHSRDGTPARRESSAHAANSFLHIFAARSDSFDRPTSFFSSGDAGSPSSLPVEQPQNKRKHEADQNPSADRSIKREVLTLITMSPGNLPGPTRDNQGHNRAYGNYYQTKNNQSSGHGGIRPGI